MPTGNLVAYDHFLKGMLLFETYDKDETARAIEELDRAVELDPRYGRAHAYAGWAYLQQFRNGWSTSPEQSLLEAEHRANVAIEVDPSGPYGHWSMGASCLCQRRHNQSHDAYQRAITLNPSNVEMFNSIWMVTGVCGQPDKAIAYLDGAMQRNP